MVNQEKIIKGWSNLLKHFQIFFMPAIGVIYFRTHQLQEIVNK